MAMSKKDYEIIARDIRFAIQDSSTPEIEKVLKQVALDLANYFQKENASFQHTTFMKACGIVRYTLRDTYDLRIIRRSDDLKSLCEPNPHILVHVLDTETGKIVWQNVPSQRYGDIGVNGNA